MTILSMLTNVADEIGIERPSSVVSSTETDVRRMLQLTYRLAKHLRMTWDWPVLTREGSITLATSTASYALPNDFERFLYHTQWDDTNNWPLLGPYTPQEWEQLQRGVTTTSPRKVYKVSGRTDTKISISPTPTSSENGNVLYFQYISTTWILPKTWVASTAFAAASYCSYNGNIYSTTAGGTTGSTPPTHTSGSASDGVVTWIFVSAAYTTFVADTDNPILNESLLALGVGWRMLRLIGNEYADAKQEFEIAVEKELTAFQGARILSFGGGRYPGVIGPWSVPDSF